MKNNYPAIVCWRITSECNRGCSFCFRPESHDLKTKEVYEIIDNLAASGVKGIGITGGEPLLRKDIAKILKYIHSKTIGICLATNTDLYSKYQKSINQYVSTIGIPLEGSTKEIHESLRGKDSFRNTTNAISKIYKNTKLQMYFSTVLTEKNIEDLVNIENLLAQYQDKVLYWKIYEIIDYPGRPFQSIKHSMLTRVRVKKAIGGLGKKLGKSKILYLSSEDRSEASFIINPNGDVIVPIDNEKKTNDIILGNLLKDKSDEIFVKWSEIIDYQKYLCHKCALKCMRDKN